MPHYRSRIITTLLLTRVGWQPQAAITRLSTLRGLPVPETEEQRAWLITTAAAWAQRARTTDGVA